MFINNVLRFTVCVSMGSSLSSDIRLKSLVDTTVLYIPNMTVMHNFLKYSNNPVKRKELETTT